jgi:hypothetical protein
MGGLDSNYQPAISDESACCDLRHHLLSVLHMHLLKLIYVFVDTVVFCWIEWPQCCKWRLCYPISDLWSFKQHERGLKASRTEHRWMTGGGQDRIIARLQQPYSLDCIPVETEYQVHMGIKSCHLIIIVICDVPASVIDDMDNSNLRMHPSQG